MLKYLTKFTMDILPSVVATIIGAYIVNHYIANKPAADAPVAAAVSTSEPRADSKSGLESRPSEGAADVANIPEAGVKAKGISEKAVFDRAAIERIIEQPSEKTIDKPADKAVESASVPETRRHPAPATQVREKAMAKTAPAIVAAPVVAAAPAAAAPVPAPSAEAAVAPEERRDATDLARAAIERLRGSSDTASRPQEAAHPAEQQMPRVAAAPPPARPLPPPITVSTPPGDAAAAAAPVKPPYADASRYDPNRPIPPADIPASRAPLDLRADATDPAPRDHTNVAEDMLSAAKSVFHAVLPKGN